MTTLDDGSELQGAIQRGGNNNLASLYNGLHLRVAVEGMTGTGIRLLCCV